MTGASDTLDPIAAAEAGIAGSKDLIAAVADDLSQHQRWLAHYHVAEKRHARRAHSSGLAVPTGARAPAAGANAHAARVAQLPAGTRDRPHVDERRSHHPSQASPRRDCRRGMAPPAGLCAFAQVLGVAGRLRGAGRSIIPRDGSHLAELACSVVRLGSCNLVRRGARDDETCLGCVGVAQLGLAPACPPPPEAARSRMVLDSPERRGRRARHWQGSLRGHALDRRNLAQRCRFVVAMDV